MNRKDLGLLVLILVVGTIVAIRQPLFIAPVNIANTANLIGLFGLFAIGQGFVIITGGIELSVGSIIALLGVLFVELVVNYAVPWPLAVLLMLLLGALIGFAHGLLITKMKMQPFIVTLCGLLIYRGVARFYTGDGTAGFTFGASFPDLEWLTMGRSFGLPHSFIAMIVVAAIMWVVLHRSVFGRHLFAVGKNEEAARYSGIRTHRVIIAAYVICAVLTAIAAIFFAMYTRSISPSSHGNFYELYAIAAAVLGGCSLRGGEGSIIGIVLGAILLQVLQNLVNLLGIPSSLNFAVMGSVILLGVLADQQFSGSRLGRRKAVAERHGRSRIERAEGRLMTYPLFSLEGRLALVTGSATGIGYALAKGMAEHGASVVVNARSAAKVEEARAGARRCRPHGASARSSTSPTTHRSRPKSSASRRISGRSTSWSTMPASSIARRSRISRRTNGSYCCRPTSPASFMSARPSRGR